MARRTESFSYAAVAKQAVIFLRTGEALAWTLLGGITAQVVGAYWVRMASKTNAFAIGPGYLDPIGAGVAACLYLLLASKPRLYDCLKHAHILFIQDYTTVGEYKAMRLKCLQRWNA